MGAPKGLRAKGRAEDAKKAMVWLRGYENVGPEMETWDLGGGNKTAGKSDLASTLSNLYKKKNVRRAFIISVVLQFSQQFSGINAIFFYSATILKAAQLDDAYFGTVLIGPFNWVAVMAVTPLMDVAGRKVLLIVSSVGVA